MKEATNAVGRALIIAFLALYSGYSQPKAQIDPCFFTNMLVENTNPNGPIYNRWRWGTEISYKASNVPAHFPNAISRIDAAFTNWSLMIDRISANNNEMSSNIIIFIDPWTGNPGAAAAIDIFFDADGYINSFMIYVNADSFFAEGMGWDGSDCPPLDRIDLESVMLHEIGHVLGLGQMEPQCYSSSIMAELITWGACRRYPFTDDWQATYILYPPYNPAATISGFAVRDGVASWKVSSEYNTVGYEIEGCLEPNGPGIPLAVTELAGIGYHTIPISDPGVPLLRLVEVEKSGMRNCQAISKQKSTNGSRSIKELENNKPSRSSSTDIRSKLEALERDRLNRAQKNTLNLLSNGEPYIIFTDSLFVDDVQLFVAGYWQSRGYDAEVVNISSYPSDSDAFRDTLKAAIADYATTLGAKYFHLIGDANDWCEFDGPLTPTLWVSGWESIRQGYLSSGFPSGGQPEQDIIPTYAVPDTLPRGEGNMAYTTPYWFSDQEYADTDDDGIPDVVVTRWPVDGIDEVLALAIKMQTYNDYYVQDYSPYTVAFYVGDVNYGLHEGGRTGDLAREYADSIESRLLEINPSHNVLHLYEKDYPDPSDRNIAASSLWNTQQPEALIMMSSNSHRYAPGYFFDKTPSAEPNQFHTGMLTSGHTPLIIASSCQAAEWAWTEDLDSGYGLPVCEEFLTDPGEGAIAWLGPAAGSWQIGNRFAALYVVEEIFEKLDRSMAESWLEASRRLHTEFSTNSEIRDLVDSYVFLGDPLSRLGHVPDAPTDASGTTPPFQLSLEQNKPNPFNPSTGIFFTLSQAGHASLKVYNVNGELVGILVNKELSKGRHYVEWGGRNRQGERVSSGVYFYVLRAEGKILTRKAVLLK